MRDIPVIFSKPMVLALIAGGKTMTRRPAMRAIKTSVRTEHKLSPWANAKPGDRLWVRENLKRPERLWRYAADDAKVVCSSKQSGHAASWSDSRKQDYAPSIHMPRWASRLTLVVVETKIERLHKISRADVLAEGIPPEEIKRWEQWFHADDCPGQAFGVLWDSINGKGEWDKNPEVVALRFEVQKQNIDSMAEAA